MSDDISPLESRITSIVGNEQRLNRDRKSALSAKNALRSTERRSEEADLAKLDAQKSQKITVNAEKERKFQADLKREGEELVNISKEIRDDYIAEIHHREDAKEKLQAKVTSLESKLRAIESGRG